MRSGEVGLTGFGKWNLLDKICWSVKTAPETGINIFEMGECSPWGETQSFAVGRLN